MVYRLFIETTVNENNVAWAFAFYNHQDFQVYKRSGIAENASKNNVILEQAGIALTYFEKSMRRRYYDEHFSTRIDEDYVTLYTDNSEIVNVASLVKSNNTPIERFDNDNLWKILLPFFMQRTMSFEETTQCPLALKTKELANSQLNK